MDTPQVSLNGLQKVHGIIRRRLLGVEAHDGIGQPVDGGIDGRLRAKAPEP